MVHKIKFIILFLISFLMCILCFIHKNHIETNIIKTLLPQNIANSSDFISIANKSSSVIKVVFEANDKKEVQDLKDNFIKEIDKNFFQLNNFDISDLINKYLSQPNNFLSDHTKKLLINKKYDEVYNSSVEKLYGVSGVQLTEFDKDPYFLLDDFLLSNKKNYNISDNHDYMQLKVNNEFGLSPDIVNKKIKELILIQKKLSSNNSKIYLAGTPIHSYYTSRNSIISINLICILSTLLIIFLTYYCSKSFKPLLPISLSLSFGMLTGFFAVKMLFCDFQIITMVFSSTLIGIGIDYSYHYFFKDNNKTFKKNLYLSFLTSSIPFILLYLTGIDLLKQVAIFIIFGLFGIYLVILFVYPEFKIENKNEIIKINDKYYKIALLILIILSLFGILRFKFNDSLTSLYTPSSKLKKAESLYSKISEENYTNTQIITVKSGNLIDEEEKITKTLNKNDINYISISKFLPSEKIQKENFELTKDLYKNNLNNFSDILSKEQINNLKNQKFTPVEFNYKDYNFLNNFLLDNNTSLIFAFSDKKIELPNKNCQTINFKQDIENYMKKYRKHLLTLLPVAIFILYIFLTFLYDFKKAIKLLAPCLAGIFCAIFISSLIMGEVNLFSVITIFLVLGFTVDYSIFRINKEEKTENAVLFSSITTSFSFLLLSFCNFKLLSSMALILMFGIISSYFAGYFILRKNNCDKI